MDEMKKKRILDDELLDQVVGGRRETIFEPNIGYVFSYSGPGSNYEVLYRIKNGDTVNTTGNVYHNQEDGLNWYELDDRSWVPSYSFRK